MILYYKIMETTIRIYTITLKSQEPATLNRKHENVLTTFAYLGKACDMKQLV